LKSSCEHGRWTYYKSKRSRNMFFTTARVTHNIGTSRRGTIIVARDGINLANVPGFTWGMLSQVVFENCG